MIIRLVSLITFSDTESAKASRRQLKEAMYTALFDMNVPAVCAINQVCCVPLRMYSTGFSMYPTGYGFKF
uniref:Uncharacterized protein n=1 Tax=Rhizophora mucronata TaxID=61149 RepID=A0A2P2KTC4_RHIMU